MIWLTTFVLIIVIKYSIKKVKVNVIALEWLPALNTIFAQPSHLTDWVTHLDISSHLLGGRVPPLNVALCMHSSIPHPYQDSNSVWQNIGLLKLWQIDFVIS